jgi:hypothetical protein
MEDVRCRTVGENEKRTQEKLGLGFTCAAGARCRRRRAPKRRRRTVREDGELWKREDGSRNTKPRTHITKSKREREREEKGEVDRMADARRIEFTGVEEDGERRRILAVEPPTASP